MALTDNLHSYYKCDDNAANTTVADAHGSNTGTSSTNTSNMSTTGKINESFDFTTDDIDIGDFTHTGGLTWSCWINPDTQSGNDDILSKYAGGTNGALLYTSDTDRIIFSYFVGSTNYQAIYTYPSALEDAGWIHVVATHDGTNGKLYVNGTLRDTVASSGTINTSTHNVLMGKRYNNTNYWDGQIDEVGIWGAALDNTEQGELYNSGSGLAYPFVDDVTILPSTLTLSTTATEPTLITTIPAGALALTLSLQTPSLQIPEDQNRGTVGTQDIATRYPVVEGLVAGTTKQTGNPNLVPTEKGAF